MNLILRLRQTPPISVKISDIRTALKSQAGFTNVADIDNANGKNVHFDLRFKTYSAWAIDGKATALFPMDLLNSKAELCRIDSNPQKNMYARVGYKLPLAQASVTHSTFSQPNVVVLVLHNATEYELHINLLWKGADTSLPTLTYVYPTDKRFKKSSKEKLLKLLEALQLSDSGDTDEESPHSSLQVLDKQDF